MKRPLAVLALAGLLGAAAPLPADEVPHLEFVRGLRARHYPDLALEYLDKLRKGNPPAPPDVLAVIPLELAKVHLDLATAEEATGRRLELYDQARKEFQEFIDKNPKSPLVADARLEVVRVTVLQGKTQLSRALMQEDMAARQKDALVARRTFVQAGGQLKAVADLLDKQVEAAPDDKTKRTLEQARLQAQMDIGLNYIDQAATYVDEAKNDVLLARAKVIGQAQPVLEKVANDTDPNNPVTWQARAWVGYCYHQNGDPNKATRKLDEVISRAEPTAAAGRRLALFFHMKVLIDPPAQESAANLAVVQKAAETWLKEYAGFKNTPEGCGVRYYLADSLARLAIPMKEKGPRAAQLNKARDLCRDLTRFENDYSEKARVLGIRIIGAEGGFDKDIAKLATFEECLVRAEYEAAQIEEFAKKEAGKPEAVEKERKARIATATAALSRALELAGRPGAKVPAAELGRARSLLCGYYLFSNKYKEAIAVGEEAARAVPPTAQGARTATYVLEAYNESINAGLRDGSVTPDDLKEKGGPAERMTDLALMMEQRWPNEQAGDVARHLRGLLLIKQKKQVEAIDALSKVSANYPAAIFVKYQLAMTAFQAAQDRNAQVKAEPDKAKREQLAKEEAQFDRQAVEALKAMPALPAGADALTTGIFLQSKVELARALYRGKQYADIDKLIDPLLDGIKKDEFKMESKERLGEARENLVILKLYAKYGAADAEFAAGHPAKVKEITDPIVEAIHKGEYAELKKNPTLRWGLLGLALRVSIQEGNMPRAQEVLRDVQKFAAEDAGGAGGKAVLMQLAVMVKEQVREVRKKKDPKLLEKAVGNFGTFLDELRKGQKAPTAEFLRIMAEAYAGLGRHETAVELARQVTEPKGDDAKDDRKVGNYRFCRLLAVRELRLDGKIDEARAALKEIKEAPWGKDYLEATKEGIHLTAVTAPGTASNEWSKLVTQLSQKIQQPGMKDQYFECYYYMTEYRLKYAQSQKDEKKRDAEVKRAAGYITKLEGPWPDLGGEESKARFTDLLEREPMLKEQYDKLKGGSK
jgi:hypothetical protein